MRGRGCISNSTASAGDVAGVSWESLKKEESKRVVWETVVAVGGIWRQGIARGHPLNFQGRTNGRGRRVEVHPNHCGERKNNDPFCN